MKPWQQWIRAMADRSDLHGEVLPSQSVIEIVGENRVLIERHQGVQEYGQEHIQVGLSFGVASVHGCNLKLTRMTHQQLVITGRIEGVSLQRRCDG